MDYDQLADATKENKVKEDAKQAFLAYRFLINSNDKKHSQLKKTVANDHAKGDTEAFPSSCHAALTLMNDFKPLVIEGTAPVAAMVHTTTRFYCLREQFISLAGSNMKM